MMQSQTSFPGKPKLLDQLRTFVRARRYSLRTEEAYLDWIRRFILLHGRRHPRDLGEQEITEFLTDLAVHRHVAASTQNQALSALLFLYQQFFERKLGRLDDALRVSRPARVPVVLTREECARVAGACRADVPPHRRSHLRERFAFTRSTAIAGERCRFRIIVRDG
jgi:site-specific recombinase XerD